MGLVEQSRFYGVIQTFVKVKGQFLNEKYRRKSSEVTLKSQLHKHKKGLSQLIKNIVLKTLTKERTSQLSTKNKKLRNL